MRVAAAVLLSLLTASPATAYYIYAESWGAGGWVESYADGSVEIGDVLGDASGNLIDGWAHADGASGGMSGYMLVNIADWIAAQGSISPNFTIEKRWKGQIAETIEDFVLDPGATELVVRLVVSATDESFLEPPPPELPLIDNGYARSHVWARLIYSNASPHVVGLGEVQVDGRADRNVPADWEQVFGGDSSPPGYGSGSGGNASAIAEIRIPASEVDLADSLLVSAQIYGEVQGGHWSGAFAKSQLSSGTLSLEIQGGDGVPLNPIFLSVPEPGQALLGECAIAALAITRRRRRG